MAPPPPCSDLALGAEGGRERYFDMATNCSNLNVSFKFSKKVNIFLLLTANLAGNRNNIETYCDNRDRVEGPATTAGGVGENGYTVPRPGHM